jgi:hypothetical protein
MLLRNMIIIAALVAACPIDHGVPPARGWFRNRWRLGALAFAVYTLVKVGLMLWWTIEPERFQVLTTAESRAKAAGQTVVPGYVSVSTVMKLVENACKERLVPIDISKKSIH